MEKKSLKKINKKQFKKIIKAGKIENGRRDQKRAMNSQIPS